MKVVVVSALAFIFICTALTTFHEISISKFRANYFDKRVEIALNSDINQSNYRMFQGTNADYVSSAFDILRKYELNIFSEKERLQKYKKSEQLIQTLDLESRVGENISNILEGAYVVKKKNNQAQVWVRKESKIQLFYDENYSIIHLGGYIPFDIHKKSNPQLDEFTIDIYINNLLVDKIEAKKNSLFNREIIIDREIEDIIGEENSFELRLTANHEVNPNQAGIGKDKRDLSFLIHDIIVD